MATPAPAVCNASVTPRLTAFGGSVELIFEDAGSVALRICYRSALRQCTVEVVQDGSEMDCCAGIDPASIWDMTSHELSGSVIVSGMPGAGKTTIAGLAGGLLPRAAQVGGDAVNQMICSGYVGFMGDPGREALRQDELCNRNMCCLANNFIDFGFTVLMDTVVADRAELDFLLALMSPRPVRLVVLAPGIEVCKQRNATRAAEERFYFDHYEQLEVGMQQEFGDLGWWFDTSALSPEQTAERLIAEVLDRATPLQPGWNAWLRRLHGL